MQWKGHLEKVYYPIPKSGSIRNKIKEELKWGIDRKSKFDKQKDFLIWSSEVCLNLFFVTEIRVMYWFVVHLKDYSPCYKGDQ